MDDILALTGRGMTGTHGQLRNRLPTARCRVSGRPRTLVAISGSYVQ